MRKNLKNMRILKGLTQEDLAKRVGIDRAYYTNIELGHKNPSYKVALKIKTVLCYENDDIFLKM